MLPQQEETAKLNGRCVLITGGTTGIGRQIALDIAALGGNVLVVGRNSQHLEETMRDSKQANFQYNLKGVIADLSTPGGIARVFEEADKHFDGQLHIMVNNAALAYQSALEGNYHEWKEIVETNLLAYIACTHEAVKRMEKAESGHIIHIGSMSANVREQGSSIYVATKTGIQGFSESFRKEVNEKGILVTLIEPGAVDTEMQPQPTEQKRSAMADHQMLQAGDIAQAAIYALTQAPRCNVAEIRLHPRLQLI